MNTICEMPVLSLSSQGQGDDDEELWTMSRCTYHSPTKLESCLLDKSIEIASYKINTCYTTSTTQEVYIIMTRRWPRLSSYLVFCLPWHMTLLKNHHMLHHHQSYSFYLWFFYCTFQCIDGHYTFRWYANRLIEAQGGRWYSICMTRVHIRMIVQVVPLL